MENQLYELNVSHAVKIPARWRTLFVIRRGYLRKFNQFRHTSAQTDRQIVRNINILNLILTI